MTVSRPHLRSRPIQFQFLQLTLSYFLLRSAALTRLLLRQVYLNLTRLITILPHLIGPERQPTCTPFSAYCLFLLLTFLCTIQEDSVLLWKSVCSNKLLANVELVLFLNKCDLLDAKLKSGIRLSKYVRSYGNRPNDVDTVAKCTFFVSMPFAVPHLL